MKISEVLSTIKQKEGELIRLYDTRKEIITTPFNKDFPDTTPIEERERLKTLFNKEQNEKIIKITNDIDYQINELVILKNFVGKANQKKGQNQRLIKMKYIRLDLSKTMEVLNNKGYFIHTTNTTHYDILRERIKNKEIEKNKIDLEIQKHNFTTDVKTDEEEM